MVHKRVALRVCKRREVQSDGRRSQFAESASPRRPLGPEVGGTAYDDVIVLARVFYTPAGLTSQRRHGFNDKGRDVYNDLTSTIGVRASSVYKGATSCKDDEGG
mgnify:CR=1 FL=1